ATRVVGPVAGGGVYPAHDLDAEHVGGRHPREHGELGECHAVDQDTRSVVARRARPTSSRDPRRLAPTGFTEGDVVYGESQRVPRGARTRPRNLVLGDDLPPDLLRAAACLSGAAGTRAADGEKATDEVDHRSDEDRRA